MEQTRSAMETIKPYLLMTSNQLSLAGFMSVASTVLDPTKGNSSTIFVLYQHLISAILLASLAFHFEREQISRLTGSLLSWAFLIGFLQGPLGELLLTSSLRYVTPSFHSVVIPMIPVVVFIIAVASQREQFKFWGLYGQAKLWGVLMSVVGSFVMVLLSHPERQELDRLTVSAAISARYVGCIMVGIAVLCSATGNILVETVAMKYPAYLTLAAMMNISGTLQTAAIAAFTETRLSSWRIRWGGSIQLLTILYGGIVVTGLSHLARIWCIHHKGPIFATGFYPLLIVFTFLIQTVILGTPTHLSSILGSLLVIGGLYLLLWAKSKDSMLKRIDRESSSSESLLPSIS